MTILYGLVSRQKTVLAEHIATTGKVFYILEVSTRKNAK